MIHHGDCVEVMAQMPPESVDAIVTDPPYGLEFMGKEWDRLGAVTEHPDDGEGPWGRTARVRYGSSAATMQDWHQRWATEALRVAKPGAYLLAFGGTRTYHRLACAIEDAGWIIRDCLVWAYAQGFPKSRANLKPAWEPIVMARKPGPLRELAIDACRIPAEPYDYPNGPKGNVDPSSYNFGRIETPVESHPLGRWPANVLLTATEDGRAIFDGDVDGVVGGGVSDGGQAGGYDWSESVNDNPTHVTRNIRSGVHFGDTGTYSRFFLIPKEDRAGREPNAYGRLVGGLEEPSGATSWDKPLRECNVCGSRTKPAGPNPEHWPACGHNDWRWEMATPKQRANKHPTVKPVELMRHLVRLVTPAGGTVLDPFLGSGTTGIAAEMEGFAWIGVEREAEYVKIAEARLLGVQKGLGLSA